MDDVAEWMPSLLRDYWDTAAESIRGEGGVILVATRPEVWGAHDRRSGGDIRNAVRLKVYEAGDQTHVRVTHGDGDKNIEQAFAIDVQSKDNSDTARRKCHEAIQVILRVLELRRRDPHPDWNEIADVSVVTANNYADYQQRVINFTLRRYGKVLPASVFSSID